MRTDMENLTNALLLIAGEDEYSERATGMEAISIQMKRAIDHRSSDAGRLSLAIIQVAESGSSIAHALERIAEAIENSD